MTLQAQYKRFKTAHAKFRAELVSLENMINANSTFPVRIDNTDGDGFVVVAGNDDISMGMPIDDVLLSIEQYGTLAEPNFFPTS